MNGFGDRVIEASRRKGSAVCVGIDPRPEWLPQDVFKDTERQELDTLATLAEAYFHFACGVIDAVAGIAVAIKPQAAFFEALLDAGFSAFVKVCRYARARGLLVIADVKRGDIGTTADAYAQAYLGETQDGPPLSDACTVNPWLGSDGVKPFMERGLVSEGGVFVLVKTSNPSSGEIQDLTVSDGTIADVVATLVAAWNAPHVGFSGYGPLGAVVGATYPEHLRRLRARLPSSILLVPGYGAQGAGPQDVVSAFDARGEGALISASRSVASPWKSDGGAPKDWRRVVEEAAVTMRDDIRRTIHERS